MPEKAPAIRIFTQIPHQALNLIMQSYFRLFFTLLRKMVSLPIVAVCVALLSGSVVASPAMVWSQKDARGVNVYYSEDGIKVVVLTGAGKNVFPNLYRGSESTWLTWIDKSDPSANQLRVQGMSAGGKVIRIDRIPGVGGYIYAPAVAIDALEQRVWLVWVGYNGEQGNLFASYLDLGKRASGRWVDPLQITPDSEYSAELPVISTVTSNAITVDWMRTSRRGSETISGNISADLWQQQQVLQGAPGEAEAPLRYQTLSVQPGWKDARLMKSLNAGQPMSADEADWKNLVRGRNAYMGAVHSGYGAAQRLMEDAQ